MTAQRAKITGVDKARGDIWDINLELLGDDGTSLNSSWVQLTQAEYDALSSPDPTILYVIVG
jgi:hypothetical protein